jgi:hypothetical protein
LTRLWPWAKREDQADDSGWSEDQEKTAKILNEEITKRLEVQGDSGKAVDTKAAVVAAAALTGTQLLAAQKRLYVPALIGALVLLAATVVLAYGALRPREFQEVPEPAELYKEYNEEPAAKVLFDLAVTKAEAFETNRGQYIQKARLQQGSLWTLAAAALFGMAARLFGG